MSAWGSDPFGHDYGIPFLRRRDPREILDYVVTGPNDLISQYRDKPRIVALLKTYLAWVQRLEIAAWEVIVFRRIENAFGATLDMIGSIVLAGRNGASDSDYRIAIRARIRVLRSAGRPQDLYAVARLSVPDNVVVHFETDWPAGVIASPDQPDDPTWRAILWYGLTSAVANGVRLGLSTTRAPTGRRLRLASVTNPQTRIHAGLASVSAPGQGGALRHLEVFES